ncbi:helix-turn-helix transcriptional regulator [Phenylobacterium sp.]|uniref:helix-turn-helix domain-containing protein n=1 Tax=Phenylobacterium sp. TaxID=1871053 RepID=UPI002B50D9A1|nr:helix-turn-helix transcriptional regulator [Phenylobacterium sp.]HLZ77158.1 helix-turn-helix transcriptional regulator [Phenylobacterium sp.]
MSADETIEFEVGGGNVFEDIGFDAGTAKELSHKAELVGLIYRFQKERALTQSELSRLVDIPQPRLSQLFKGKIADISTDKLLHAIASLGAHITIRVEHHPAPEAAGRVELEFA